MCSREKLNKQEKKIDQQDIIDKAGVANVNSKM